uniref:Uncharacterized protein n=1 Tax=Triticum urartu TaxID=4572 RepID=A0A8R7TQ75_TRIUA
PSTTPPRPSLLLVVSSIALKISATSPTRGVRWQGVGIDGRSGRIRAVGRFLVTTVEEAGALEDGVLLPKEGSEAAGRSATRCTCPRRCPRTRRSRSPCSTASSCSTATPTACSAATSTDART